jgi:hypothetical protein
MKNNMTLIRLKNAEQVLKLALRNQANGKTAYLKAVLYMKTAITYKNVAVLLPKAVFEQEINQMVKLLI